MTYLKLIAIDLDEKQTTDKYSMLDIMDLNYAIDSLKKSRSKGYKEYSDVFLKRTDIEGLNGKVVINKDSLKKHLRHLKHY